MPKRRPCQSCPWRKSTKTQDIPGGGMDHIRSQGIQGNGLTVMACHLSTDADPFACAGFIVQVGFDSIGIRLLANMGALKPDDFESGGAELHGSVTEMLAVHPDPMARLRGLRRRRGSATLR